jgi:hypothetical protein
MVKTTMAAYERWLMRVAIATVVIGLPLVAWAWRTME